MCYLNSLPMVHYIFWTLNVLPELSAHGSLYFWTLNVYLNSLPVVHYISELWMFTWTPCPWFIIFLNSGCLPELPAYGSLYFWTLNVYLNSLLMAHYISDLWIFTWTPCPWFSLAQFVPFWPSPSPLAVFIVHSQENRVTTGSFTYLYQGFLIWEKWLCRGLICRCSEQLLKRCSSSSLLECSPPTALRRSGFDSRPRNVSLGTSSLGWDLFKSLHNLLFINYVRGQSCDERRGAQRCHACCAWQQGCI